MCVHIHSVAPFPCSVTLFISLHLKNSTYKYDGICSKRNSFVLFPCSFLPFYGLIVQSNWFFQFLYFNNRPTTKGRSQSNLHEIIHATYKIKKKKNSHAKIKDVQEFQFSPRKHRKLQNRVSIIIMAIVIFRRFIFILWIFLFWIIFRISNASTTAEKWFKALL